MVSIKNKVIVITGASGGMGCEISRMLAAEGAKLALFSNDTGALESLAGELSSETDLIYKSVDVRFESEVSKAIALTVEKLGTPEALLTLSRTQHSGED